MSVDFTDNGDETSDCDICGETIDNDHYADMEAHDTGHRVEQQRIDNLPRVIIVRSKRSPGTFIICEKNSDGTYGQAILTQSLESAKKVEKIL